MPNLSFRNHIILDKLDSWPKKILEVISEFKNELDGYLNEEHRMDKLAEEVLEYRHRKPENIYKTIWNDATEVIERELKNTNFIGFHCSRLLDFEMNNITTHGLRPLDLEFSNSRIKKIYSLGLIKEEFKNKLLNKVEFSASNRAGNTCFFHSTSTLKDEWGLIRLFKSWGGEAMYLNFEEKTELQKLGMPCIVIASIKREQLTEHFQLSERMICIRLNNNYRPNDFDSFLKTEKVKVLRIVTRNEPLFDELTNIKHWTATIE